MAIAGAALKTGFSPRPLAPYGPDAVGVYLGTGLAYDMAGWHTAERLIAGLGTHQRYTPTTIDNAPILLTAETHNPNGAQALFLIDGAEPGALDGYSRCLVLFDGKDEDQLALARRQWSALKAGGASLAYWKQGAQGGWEKQA